MDQERKETEQEIEERFDREMRQAILDASNQYRKEHGLPLITAEEAANIDTLSAPENLCGGEKTEDKG